MPSHAEKNPIEIENYYHIIDPKRKLSEKERAEEVNRVLVNMPACFPEALRYVMTRFGFTQEALAFESKVLNLRITKAKQMLRFTDKKLEDIGYQCGLGAPHYFSRIFKQVEGITPSEFREKW